jgi:uncharacterized membrane protein YgdD (TMEM256/DUF423 family)
MNPESGPSGVTSAKFPLVSGCVCAFMSVALGAFGAHMLKARISPDMLANFQTGVLYQMFHSIALIAIGGILLTDWGSRATKLGLVSKLFVAGIAMFSGSLYVMALTGAKWLGAVTPIGGICFLSGWAIATVAAASLPASRHP